MNVEIFIVSYAHDIPYLEWNLKSITKFASGFSGVTILIPADEDEDFLALQKACPEINWQHYTRDPDPVKWHLHAQCMKCRADTFCKKADFILHTDSDCIFTEPVTPEDYFVDGIPVMLIEPYAKLPNYPWQPVVEDILKTKAVYETMRRHPQVNPRGIYRKMRRHIEKLHDTPFDDYVLSRKPTFPWGWTEHNVIGSYALLFHRSNYHWIDISVEPRPLDKLKQFWSYKSPELKQESPNDHDWIVPLEMCKKLIG